jgi:glucose/arabinose dehydrogenase
MKTAIGRRIDHRSVVLVLTCSAFLKWFFSKPLSVSGCTKFADIFVDHPAHSASAGSLRIGLLCDATPKSNEPSIEIIARGVRNANGFAWDNNDRLFSISNGPDVDQPEEMDFIESGNHYGFPYQFGNVPAAEGRPDSHTPKAPEDMSFTMPIANLGPAAGGNAESPCYYFGSTFQPRRHDLVRCQLPSAAEEQISNRPLRQHDRLPAGCRF